VTDGRYDGSYTVAVGTKSVKAQQLQMSPNAQLQTRVADALERAWRTFKTGLGLDIMVALAIIVAPAVSDLKWTKTWWLALAALAGKTVVQAVASYLIRRYGKSPRVGPQV
jgi:uncharacterized membrane protein YdcZ (DUF606 family)